MRPPSDRLPGSLAQVLVVRSSFRLFLMTVAAVLFAAPFAAADEAYCPPEAEELSPTEYVRALSLDLLGVVPTLEQLESVATDGDVPEAMIDEMLASDSFADRVVRHHRALIWNNVSDVRYVNQATNFNVDSGIYWRQDIAQVYRGDRVRCLDEPASFDGDEILTTEIGVSRREGWVEVRPYWAMDTTIRVCAFDAQIEAASPSGTPCDALDGHGARECGCGPNLIYCRGGGSNNLVDAAFNEEVERRIHDVIARDHSYLELFTGTTMWVNGPLTHFLRYRSGFPDNSTIAPLPYERDILPDLEWTDTDTWVEIDGGDHQAGLLTSPAFLLRFPTNRARASRFYDAFLCDPFTAPEGSLPAQVGRLEPDLQLRDGCNYCHGELEPAAAHWGRWSQQGSGYLDPDGFPAMRPDCQQCALEGRFCGAECDRYYVMDARSTEEIPYLGWLRSYVFLRETNEGNIDQGPRALALRGAATGQLDRCVATRTAEWLLGRGVDAEVEYEWIETLADEFADSGYQYRDLVRAIVQSESYRRVR